MSMDRRHFLKIAGLTGLLGLGGGAATAKMLWQVEPPGSHFDKNAKKLTAKQWAMVVDMDKFGSAEEYNKCIKACHEVHNVPDQLAGTKNEIKWIWTDTYEHVFAGQANTYLVEEIKDMPFLTLCNHCENPPCVRVCPTKATFKTADGITMMDYHRCIGCRFCMAACPYGARSFNYLDPRPSITKTNKEFPTRTIGVVEKCTFCAERLNKGLLPACVEATKESGALVFGDLSDENSEVRKILSESYTIRRKNELGTEPSVYYVIRGGESHV